MKDDLATLCAAVLATSASDSVISSVTAARLHGMWLPALPDEVHVATAAPERAGRAMTRTKRPELVPHRLQLAVEDVTTLCGVQVMTPARAWRDLAGALTLPDLVAAGDSVLRSGTPFAALADVIDRTRLGRFARRARQALALVDGRSRSRPESHLRVAVHASGRLPRFQVNASVHRDEGGWLAEPDLSLPEAKLMLEYQGADHADVVRMRKDITRRRDARDERWLCLDYGPAEVFGRPWTIEAEVRREIAERAPQLLRPLQSSSRVAI